MLIFLKFSVSTKLVISQRNLLGGTEHIMAAESVRNYQINFTRLCKMYVVSPDKKKL